MKEQTVTEAKNKARDFEELYIYSFSDLSHHVSLLLDSYEEIQELLIQTYVDAYYMWEDAPKKEEQISWLKGIADDLAVTKWDVKKENIDCLYTGEEESALEKKAMFIDETSVFLSVEDRLGLMEKAADSLTMKAKVFSGLQGLFSCVLLIMAIVILTTGIDKVSEQWNVIKEPIVKPLAEAGEGNLREQDAERHIQVGKKVVYLSDIGHVLYSLPVEESSSGLTATVNPEIQKQAGWTYYLPCPERNDTQLAEVAPSLDHTLYRMRTDGANEIEIIAREVDNYTFWEDSIYVEQFDRVQRIELNESFEKQTPGIYPEVRNQEIYLYDTLGRTLRTDSDGSISFGDRILKMSSNRVVEVTRATQKHGGASYYFKHTDKGQSREVYRNLNGKEEVFAQLGTNIDSFCLVGEWLYFSAYIRNGNSGSNYSAIYKKSLVGNGDPERIHDEFAGRIFQMYYSESGDDIYAHYTPKSWNSNYSVIAVISPSGQMSILNDKELRATEITSGNDMLQFVLAYDDQVYCFWEDCVWKKGENPVTVWRKVLVIPMGGRIQMKG